MQNTTGYQRLIRLLTVLFWVIAIIGFSYVLIVYLYPFFIGLIISFIFIPAVNFIEKNFGWGRTSAVFSVILAFIVIFTAVISLLVVEIVAGLSYLTKELPHYIQDAFEKIHQWFDSVIIPIYEGALALTSQLNTEQQTTIHQSIERLLGDISVRLGNIVQNLLNGLADFLLSLPNTVTVLFFALLGAFFITKDWPVMIQWIEQRTPKKVKILVNKMIKQWKHAIVGYALAQLTLVSITGIIVYIGLLIIGVEYAITTALLIAIVDLLPYLGTGLVFIPWIIYAFVSGHWPLTIGLAILYAVVIIQRQLAEPKVMSKHMGIPTLALLITLFSCYQFFGIFGLLIGPAILVFILSIIKAGVIEEVIGYVKGSPR
ncbi:MULTISPECIES: sporulation integral membrane protein YtvI [Bacillaceae]|uniref:Sporulation integral membrane protein YtvI n=1 Tax=Evansella alkalicola TaxID=745819 RepID=A0ABS6JRH4_9BACI|nr:MULTISPECIES: sporulation integral membrane protein YtvI [Bacillaceae]MBU9721145.1 sporulation integral membrane protein YtvI [Bacillus alkalicola]